MSRTVLGALLVVAWVLLWGDLSVANVLSGTAVVLLLFLVFPSVRPVLPRTILHPWAFVRLVVFVFYEMVVSNLLLAREVVSPRSRVHSRIVEVEMRTQSEPLLTLITNITALTPGTMTVAVQTQPPIVTLHTLVLHDPETVAASVGRLEELCVRAFGTAEAIAEIEEADR